ncbi:MAG TPA: hypothetical protein PKX18_04035 [Thermosynergistes sp.]|nr:hypothetical protein [Thermosynergistes sp.]
MTIILRTIIGRKILNGSKTLTTFERKRCCYDMDHGKFTDADEGRSK